MAKLSRNLWESTECSKSWHKNRWGFHDLGFFHEYSKIENYFNIINNARNIVNNL